MDRLIEQCHKFLTSDRVKAWLKEQWNSHLKSYNYDTRVCELEEVVKELKKRVEEIHHKVDEEELRYGREILVDVKNWIEKVDQLLIEYETFTKDPYNEFAVFDLSKSGGYLPKPGIRYRQSIKAYDITRKADGLLQTAATFVDTFSHWSGPPSMAAFFSNFGYESFPSREETMTTIIEELGDPTIRMIGLYGLSGVGKTTLVKEIVKNALRPKEKMFDVVAMASVTRNFDIRKIQAQIADMLGVTLNEESDIARAARIQKVLKNEKKSTLIILDDLCEKLDLNMLGISYEMDNDNVLKNVREGKSRSVDGLKNDKEKNSTRVRSTMESKKRLGASADKWGTVKTLSRYKGCKILIISQSRQVLSSQMEGKANPIIPMEVLTEKESEMLFKKMAGIHDKNSEFEKLAAQIANKCYGLPMSIITTARALKNQSRSVWENIHQRLVEGQQNLAGRPEFSTKLSYDHLEDDELKYTFLLCAHMGRDALIMDLVKYCIGLGFLRGIYTVRETRNRVYSLVAKLKESGLLSDSYSRDQFTMQDIVRNSALSIAYMKNHSFTMTAEKIDEWPDILERYAAISFYHCDFVEGFPRRINYPGLRVFQVTNNDPNLKIPRNFFKGMKELKVLILIGIHLSLSESSISSLKKLRMLCLEQCSMLDKELSIIGKLKKLRILSFSGSDIKNLPVELKHLEKLQIFDISNCSKLKEIPSGVISSLVRLEGLYMRNTLIQWEEKEPTRQSKIVLLSELKYLNQLATLDIQIPNVSFLPNNLFFDKLHSYKIVIGDLTAYLEADFMMPEKYETLKFLAIRLKHGFDIHSLTGVKMLFERVEYLFLEELNGVHDIFYRLNLKGFLYLKHLWIRNNSTIQSLIHPMDRKHPEKAFPKLESLYLYNLEKMDKICSCELSEPSFGKLKVIKINLCGKLKTVFSLSVVRLLTLLETIEVSECDSLESIVPMEGPSDTNNELLKFPELRFLKLQSLSQFMGLYPIEERKELFYEKVEVSKLERMELSSIPIDMIWSKSSDQPSPRSSFQNLIHLDVNGCCELKYLISFAMANSLVSLQSLFVSECEKMTNIFHLEPRSHQEMKGSTFPKLKNIKLHRMKSLSEIWNKVLHLDSFNKLDTLIIEECDKLVNVFPRYTEGMFRSLCNLRVTNCKSMQGIFDLDDKRDFGREYLPNLQDVHLEALPKLEHVWDLNKDRVLNMNNLQKIRVQDCDGLKNIFPFSVAIKCLHNLEYLVVCDCFKLREIVAKGEAPNAGSDNHDPSFDFPKLSTVKFSALPELMSFYPGAYELFCPTLNDLSVELCDMLEPFSKQSTNAQRKLVIFPEKIINKLKSMQIESRHAKSPSSYMGKGNHRRDNLEELCLSRLIDTEILYSFLHRNPNLGSLSLNNCSFEEIVPPKEDTEIENFGVVPKLKNLKLIDMPELKEIRFEPDIILGRIELLILQNCPCMTTVVPSSVSLTHLTNLEVVNCDGLKNLMSASTAKSLGQLNTMKVIKCESLMEIVTKGENAGKVVFKQLKALELVSLGNLKSFCSSDNCEFEFPSLEKLVVSACYNMEQFSENVTSTPILQNIYVVHEKQKKRCCWEGDLNATMQKVFNEKKYFEGMAEINFSKHPELRQAWQVEVDMQNSWFYSLKILKLENCEIQPCAIPSHILPYLKTLKELEVRDIDNVKVIFDMNVTEGAGIGTTLQLQKLTLQRLPNLVHVWKRNGNGTHSFQNLQLVFVGECNNLQTVFPAAVAKNLKKLDHLEIEYCDGLLEIVGKEEDTATNVTQKFAFPWLTTLDLQFLPELIYFYPQPFTLDCPLLNKLYMANCPKLELFELKDISNIENMLLGWKGTLVLRSKLGEFKDNLEYLNEIHLIFDVDENEKHILPIEILQKAPNLKEMSIQGCGRLQVFRNRIPEIDGNRMLRHVRILTLRDVSKLQSIGSMDSPWLNVICDKLHKFNVYNSPDLTRLVDSTSAVSFSYLKELFIVGCKGLEYLFTSSAANKLKQLEHIEVWECESLKQIVAEEQDDTTSGVIKLERLYRIDLNNLSSLECFYSGNGTLQLPSLIQVDIWKCPNMEIFYQGSITADSFRGIQASTDSNDELILSNDVNSSVKEVFLQWGFFYAVDDDYFSENLFGKVGLQNKWLCNLVTLNLDSCTLSYAIPSSILPCLNNLEELQVQDSDKVEVIFDMNESEIMITTSQLKKLTLERLSNLLNVWEKNHPGVLIFQNLQEVIVSDCENLQTLFPFSLAKKLEKLEKLDVESCHELKEIVEKGESSAADIIEKFVFPCLEKLHLYELPEVTCFYPQTFTLECPSLNSLYVSDCHKFELFQREHPMDESTSINRQPLISNLKVISKLKELKLDWKHISASTLRFRSEQFVEGLNFLQKISLYFDADEDEQATFTLPIEILQKAPNLIEMSINYCNVPKILFAQNLKIGEEGILGQLKILTLWKVSTLQSIELEDSLWLNTVYEKLHELHFLECPDLTTIEHTVSFSCLKKVSISNCPELKYLFTSSAAKKLMNLEEITVKECESVKEILMAEDGDATNEAIKFVQLKTIVLHSLPSLVCFYSGSDSLQLSCLVDVHVWECPNMKIFCKGVTDADSFRGVQMSLDPNEDLLFHQDLNKTVKGVFQRQAFFQAVDKDCFSGNPELQEDWRGKIDLQNKWLCNLVTLKLDQCTLPYAIPSVILLCLKNLQELEVRDSDKVEVIFDMNDSEVMETTSQLKKLTLQQLSKLVHVWERNNDRVLIYQNLQEVIVSDCENLQTLFPASLAKNLENLEKLKIHSCHKLQEIVEMEECAEAGVTEKFVLPRLEKLHLYDLPEVTCFYPQTFTLECPSLNSLYVSDCNKFELFQSEHPMSESTSINRRPLLLNLKVISKLKKLRIDWKHILTFSLRLRSEELAEGLNYLEYISLFFDTNENENAMLPIEILQKAPNLTRMSIDYCDSPETLFAQNLKIGEDGILGQLKILILFDVSALQSIESEDSTWLNTVCDKLHELDVDRCPDLTTLVHTASFSCLKKVSISNCPKLKYLFTSSAAKKLMNLEEITVKECESVKEILMAEDGDATNEAIKFVQLKTIVLHSLPSLGCFYSGSDTLQLSCLVDVHVWECPDMKIFSKGVIDSESFQGIQMSLDTNQDLLFHQDLNATVKGVFQRQAFFQAVDKECFSDNPELKEDWRGKIDLQNKWLCNLVTLKLDECTLPYAIPSAILLCLKKLEELEVGNSDKVEVIFDMNDSEVMETTSHMKKLTLRQLSKLVHVWERNSDRVLTFQNLQDVIVTQCKNLQTLFPASLAKNLEKLEKLDIRYCHKLKEIVEKEESTAADVTEKFVFPCLEKLHLHYLPQLTCFYPQTFTVEFPALNKLFVVDCDNFELFQSGHPVGGSTSINRQPPIPNLKVISKLTELTLHWKHISALTLRFISEEFPEGLNYLENISLFFYDHENEKPMLPIEILQKAPNLIGMSIQYCKSTKIFLAENIKIGEDRMLGQLKTLTLYKVSALQSIESEDSSWLNTVSEKLHKLHVEECPDLTTLVHTMSFSCLKKVSISKCPKLQYLFTSSAAKKLMNLEEITVKECESVKEIVMAEEGDATNEAIKFVQLKTIVLHSLPSLVCFYSGSDTLQLSSLVDVHVWECHAMKIFSKGVIDSESFQGIQMSLDTNQDLLFHQDLNATVKGVFQRQIFSQGVIDADSSRGIQVSLDPNQDLLFHRDLNATLEGVFQRQVFFEAVDKDCFSDNLELQEGWRGKVDLQNKWLCNLVTLKINKCTLPYAIPSPSLACLKNLQELEVWDSDKVDVIFDMNDSELIETTSQLKKLTLQRLSNLLHVWERNSHGVLIFQNLQEVVVSGCQNLQTLFPPSLAKNLEKLEKLEIESCHKLQEIVEKEESTAANVIEKFVFPCLEKLHLYELPEVTCFYPQTFTLECPSLNSLYVSDCHKFELFQSAPFVDEGEGGSTSISRRPLISNPKVISKLKELKLDWKHIWTLSLRLRSEEFEEGLNYLENMSLFFNADENEKAMLPFEIFQQAPNLIEMSINYCNVPEIFLVQNPEVVENRILGQLEMLTLHKVSILQSIESEDSSWLNTICEKLHELNVDQCSHLTSLVHTVSFSCLKKVSISKCPQLQYLFTSSAAKKLMNLEKITVKECESMKAIVAKEGDGTNEAIQFEQLKTIVLHCLPSLISFHSGSDTLQLSCLVDVHVWECPDMKIFSKGVTDAESFRGIQMSLDPNEDLLFHQDLNATVKCMFQRQAFFQAAEKECFSDNPELQEDWRGKIDLQNKWLCNLTTLKLNKCTLSYAIPSSILACLNNLQELEVRDSDKVKAIFDMNDTDIMEKTSQLKKLTLQRLSKLAHVWERNCQGLLIFQNLQEVLVGFCGDLQSLFPASLAKNLEKLEKLEIVSCYKLQEIVEKEESTAANVTEKFVFPCMKKLRLSTLLQVTCFYPQTFTLECPALTDLSVVSCRKLELFKSAHDTSEDEGTSYNRQALISNLKVISKLKKLTLDWKHIWTLSLRLRSEEFAEGLNYLENIILFFNADENEKAMLPIEILQKAPNLVGMSIRSCKAPEILFAQKPKIGDDGILGQLKIFELWKVSALQSIQLEDTSWLTTICEKLNQLYVVECPHLTTLVHKVSFSCLKKLFISKCPQLQYLFSSSAAEKLMNLEEITVKQCESMKEIVAKDSREGDKYEHKGEGEDKYENEVIFGKLEFLKFYSLPKFESFYMGSSTLSFLSLKEVWFDKCYSTKVFRLRDKLPVKLKVAIDGSYKKGDIHSLIIQPLEEEAA